MKDGKLGIALVGLGMYSEGQLGPALRETAHCYLAGIVTGSPQKKNKWKTKYFLPEEACYTYETFDNIKHSRDIDIVYVVLPNALHAEYVIRAAKADKHVICEKPLAITVEQCDRMITTCEEAGVQLSVGYRLHFEPHNKELMRMGQGIFFGSIKLIEAEHSLRYAKGWRIKKALAGGGALMDVGIYCLHAARYCIGAEPIAVTAQEGPKKYRYKFKEVEEAINWQMEFPGGEIAHCTSSYIKKQNRLHIKAENGWAELTPAYSYRDIKGKTAIGEMDFPQVNQQALQLDDFALCIKEGRRTRVPGEMGRQDVKIMMAVYKAMTSGERIVIE